MVRADTRLSPRVPLRRLAVLSSASHSWDAVMEDLAAGGCRVVSPVPLRRGAAVFVEVRLPASAGAIACAATVVGSSGAPPWRLGLAFPRLGEAPRARALRAAVEADPGLLPSRPSPLPNARLRLGPAPAPTTLFSREERTVLRAARDGETVLGLVARAPREAATLVEALVGLRERGLVEEGALRRADGRWAARLGPVEARPALPPPEPAPHPFAPGPARAPLGQACLDLGRAQGAAGHLSAAVAWLHAAQEAVPGDPEIAAALDAVTAR